MKTASSSPRGFCTPLTRAPPQPFALLIVADGMGGRNNGQEAGRLAIQYLLGQVGVSLFSKQMTPDALLALLMEGIQYASHQLYQCNQKCVSNMGTTITAALVSDATAYVANVGDSRAYLYRASSGLAQITRDHSLVAALVQAGMIEPDGIYTHPRRNLIYRCLGEKRTYAGENHDRPTADSQGACRDSACQWRRRQYRRRCRADEEIS